MVRKIIYFSLLATLIYACKSDVQSIQAVYTDMTESVYASVTVQPQDMYDAYTAKPGIIKNIYVEEGDSINKGELIARISSKDQEISIENARIKFDQANENYRGKSNLLKNIDVEISLLKNQLIIDSLNYFRQIRLWDQNVGSLSDLERKKLTYDQTKSNIQALNQKYAQAEIDLQNAVETSKNFLDIEKTRFQDFDIRSKINGKVYSLYKNEGEQVLTQEALARIGDAKSFIIEMLIDEVDIAKVNLVQKVYVKLDAYPAEVFEASIEKIYPVKDNRTQTFLIESTFVSPPKKLYAGLSGEANIVLQEKQNTLAIPIEYLMEGNKVKTEEEDIIEVKTGLRSINHVEIISGIDSSTQIIKP